uniref:RRM domain-containing protein n=1 Tax=Polytomella parva TaxID=51329 RepID=A0A7S0UW09_9CHLO
MKPQSGNTYFQNDNFQSVSNSLSNSASQGLTTPEVEASQIRTVFVTGFPADVTPKEFHNLVRFFTGYEASQLHNKTGVYLQAFALFNNHASAVQACNILNQLPYDAENTLTAKIAHKNLYLKDAPTILRADTTGKVSLNIAWVSPSSPSSSYPVSQAPSASNLPGYLQSDAPVRSPVSGFAPVLNKYDNLPCNTLFIGNLGDSVDEAELRLVFGSLFGFKQLKLICNPRQVGGSQVSCFVEFSSVTAAAAVHASMQGAIFNSSDRGPIRIQYSKNPFGKRSAHPGVAQGIAQGVSAPQLLSHGLMLGDGAPMFLPPGVVPNGGGPPGHHINPGALPFGPGVLGEVSWSNAVSPFPLS